MTTPEITTFITVNSCWLFVAARVLRPKMDKPPLVDDLDRAATHLAQANVALELHHAKHVAAHVAQSAQRFAAKLATGWREGLATPVMSKKKFEEEAVRIGTEMKKKGWGRRLFGR